MPRRSTVLAFLVLAALVIVSVPREAAARTTAAKARSQVAHKKHKTHARKKAKARVRRHRARVRRTKVVTRAVPAGESVPAFGVGHVKSEWLAGYNSAEGLDPNGVADLGMMRDANLGLYRARFRLEQVIDADGGFTRWTMLDNLVLQAAWREITVLPILIRMQGDETYLPPRSDEDRAALRDFAAAAAARYGPGGWFWTDPTSPWASCGACTAHPIRVWEVWNEQNAAPYWDNPDPEQYAAALTAARYGLRSADPSARVLFGGLADVGDTPRPGEIKPAPFLRRAIAAVGPDAFDAVAVHAYHPDPAVAIERVQEIVQTLRTYAGRQSDGQPRHQIWITEFGAPGYAGDAASNRRQSDFVKTFVDTMVQNRSRWNIGPLLPYCLRDLKVASEQWHVLGMRRTTAEDTDAGAKASWDTLLRRTRNAPDLPLPVLRR